MFRKIKSVARNLFIASGAIVFSVGIYAVTAEFVGPGLKGSTDADRPLGTAINLLVGTNADQIEISNDCSSSTAEICLDADNGYDMDSSNVVANASGSVIERLEWIMTNKVDDKNCQAGGVTSGTNDFDSEAVTYDIDYTLTGVMQTGTYINALAHGQETYTASLSCEQTVVTVSNESVLISCESGYHEEGGDCAEDITVADVFSTTLYTGNGSSQTIENGIDLANEGGLVWTKMRTGDGAPSNYFVDTIRGENKVISSNSNANETTQNTLISAFNVSGYDTGTLGSDNADTYVSWTFRQAPRFFDVVTYTGDETIRNISHNLGVAPGMIMVKNTSVAGSWNVYHKSLNATKALYLNSTSAEITGSSFWNNTEPTSTNFTIGSGTWTNQNGQEYIAYLFAHDPSADGMIQCGSVTDTQDVDLGWIPQFIMFKKTDGTSDWVMMDTARGWSDAATWPALSANTSVAEFNNTAWPLTANGFRSTYTGTWAYCAIRQEPDTTPDTFSFSDQNEVALNTLTESNIVQITGIDTPSAVTVTGDGSPEFRICSDVDCTTEVQTWGTVQQTIENNQYLQLRLTSSAVAGVIQRATVTVGTESVSWEVTDNPIAVEDVFSTYLYTGNGATQTIENGIDLANEGGLVWLKKRNETGDNFLFDTIRWILNNLRSNKTDADNNTSESLTSFNFNGFSLGSWISNAANGDYSSWTFRQASKFFDIVTYTGDGQTGRQIAHDLGVEPGMIVIKATSGASEWYTYHKDIGLQSVTNTSVVLNRTNGADAFGNPISSVSSDNFGLYTTVTNANDVSYVAYLFAHDPSEDGKMQCGSYTWNGNADGPEVDLGWEPQWLMAKRADSTGSWELYDSMRGLVTGGNDARLFPNGSDAEAYADMVDLQSSGFKLTNTSPIVNANGGSYIYCAIRKAPMKEVVNSSEVFSINDFPAGAASNNTLIETGFETDLALFRGSIVGNNYLFASSRIQGGKSLYTNGTNAELNTATEFDHNDWFVQSISNDDNGFSWSFKRALGFFDVVAYTGDGVAGRTVEHNLGVAPEMMIVKRRNNNVADWIVYSKDETDFLKLNTSEEIIDMDTVWNDTFPTSDVFSLGDWSYVNNSGDSYISYLFATVPDVSKVGFYTGTAADLDIDAGFTQGTRFVLIKRTDSTGDWYLYDAERGIVEGNDPYLLLNTTAAEVTSTDYIDPINSGFRITASAPAALNAVGGEYIFLAIANPNGK